MTIDAVIFDLGGVVLGSPLHAIAEYERDLGISKNFINHVVVDTAPHGAWSRLERGEISLETFYTDFETDCAGAGDDFSAREMMDRIGATNQPRQSMLEAIERIRSAGLKLAALTNNWLPDEASGRNDGTRALRDLFDVFVESSVEGLRKPDPRIYQRVCQRLEVSPEQAVFLDDIGGNLKSARQLGMSTIKVDAPEQALRELSQILGFDLLN